MQKIIYGAVLAVLAVLAISTLLVYYLQPFEENYEFSKRLNYSSINFETYQEGDVVYLQSASAELGTLSLENTGFFGRVYKPDNFIGCIDAKEGEKSPGQFSVEIVPKDSASKGYNSYYYNNEIELAQGEEREFIIKGTYSSYRVLFSSFSRDIVEGVSIYKIDSKEKNPIDLNYDSSYRGNYQDCTTFKQQNKKPFVSIPII